MARATKAGRDAPADAFMAELDHPLKAEIEAVRKLIRGIDPAISDGVKWNSLSFRTDEWFATLNLRSANSLQLVLHLGAKVGKTAARDAIPDPRSLLDWRGPDRAIATLGAGKALEDNQAALKVIVKAWIACV